MRSARITPLASSDIGLVHTGPTIRSPEFEDRVRLLTRPTRPCPSAPRTAEWSPLGRPRVNAQPLVRRPDSPSHRHYRARLAATFDALAREALVLPPDQRIAPAHRLLSSVEAEPDPDAEAAWEQEIVRRILLSDAGDITPPPAAEAFARLRRIAPDQT